MAELAVALRVQPKLDDARSAIRQLKQDLVDLKQSAQAAVTGTTNATFQSAPESTPASTPEAAPATADSSAASVAQTAEANTTAVEAQAAAIGETARAAEAAALALEKEATAAAVATKAVEANTVALEKEAAAAASVHAPTSQATTAPTTSAAGESPTAQVAPAAPVDDTTSQSTQAAKAAFEDLATVIQRSVTAVAELGAAFGALTAQLSAVVTQTNNQGRSSGNASSAIDKERQALDRLIATLDPAAGNAQRLAAAQDQLNNALSKGMITQDEYNRLLAVAQKQFSGTGVSAGQTAQALRQLPAQITDITTSLASGMPVWLVAIQQGGQIRDSFGGIGPALRSVAGVINPVVLGLAAVAAAAALMVKSVLDGEEEAERLGVALQTTGNAAGATSTRLQTIAEAAHDISGISEDAAQSAAVAMVQSGRIGIETIGNLTKSIAGYAEATGQSTDKAGAALAKLFSDPKQALKELDDQFNLLTPVQRAYIDQLIEQGKTEQAEIVLSEAMADRFGKTLPENLGYLQQALKNVRDAAHDAVSELMSLGKQSSLADQIKQNQAEIDELRAPRPSNLNWILNVPARLQAALQKQADLRKQQADADKKADDDEAKAAKDRHIKALTDDYNAQAKALESNAQKIAKKQKDLSELVNAGIITPAQSAAQLKAFTDHLPKGNNDASAIAGAQAKASLDDLQHTFEESDAKIVKALSDGRKSIDQAYQERVNALKKEVDDEKAVLESELANPKLTKQQRIEIDAHIKSLDADLSKRSRELDDWKKKEEQNLAGIAVKLQLDTSSLTGQFDRDAVQKQLDLQYADDMKATFRLSSPSDVIAAQQQIELLKDAALGQAEFNSKLEEAQRLQTQLGVTEQAAQQQADSGQISQIEAQARINKARQDQVPILQSIIDQLGRIRDAMPPEAAAAIDKMNVSIAGLQNQVARDTPAIVDFGTKLKNSFIDNISDAAGNAIANWENLGDAVKSVLKQILGNILSSNIKQALTYALTPDSPGGTSAGSTIFGSIFSGLKSASSSIFSGVKSIFGFAEGGLIRGPGTGTSDSIPALVGGVRPIRVSDGEFIQNTRAVQHYGLPFMEAIRTLRLPKPAFALGGLVSASRTVARFAAGGAVSSGAAAPAGTPSSMRIEISNSGTPKSVRSASSSFDSRDFVVRLVLADAADNGPMTRAITAAQKRK